MSPAVATNNRCFKVRRLVAIYPYAKRPIFLQQKLVKRFHCTSSSGLDFHRHHRRAYLHEEIHLRIRSVFLPHPMVQNVFAVFGLGTFQVLGHKLLAESAPLGNVMRGERQPYGRDRKA